MSNWSKYNMENDIKRSKSEDHLYGIKYYFENFLKLDEQSYSIKDISSQCKKNKDFLVNYVNKSVIIECKSDYYKLSNSGFYNENCVFEIVGSVDYNLVKKYFGSCEELWKNGGRKSTRQSGYDTIHNCIRSSLNDPDVIKKVNLGYFFSVPEEQKNNLFIYYYNKYNKYIVIDGNGIRDQRGKFVRKTGVFLKKIFKEKNDNCFLQIAPNERNGNKYLTINLLVPLHIVKNTDSFITEFDKKVA